MRRGLVIIAIALAVAIVVPSVASAAPAASETQTYVWGECWRIDYGPQLNKWLDSSLKVFKSNATVYQLQPADWSTTSGWTAQRFLLMGKADAITWAGGTGSATKLLADPSFLAWANGRSFTASMVQDERDSAYYQVTQIVFH